MYLPGALAVTMAAMLASLTLVLSQVERPELPDIPSSNTDGQSGPLDMSFVSGLVKLERDGNATRFMGPKPPLTGVKVFGVPVYQRGSGVSGSNNDNQDGGFRLFGDGGLLGRFSGDRLTGDSGDGLHLLGDGGILTGLMDRIRESREAIEATADGDDRGEGGMNLLREGGLLSRLGDRFRNMNRNPDLDDISDTNRTRLLGESGLLNKLGDRIRNRKSNSNSDTNTNNDTNMMDTYGHNTRLLGEGGLLSRLGDRVRNRMSNSDATNDTDKEMTRLLGDGGLLSRLVNGDTLRGILQRGKADNSDSMMTKRDP